MGYCAIITFENGLAKHSIEFRNPWGGASYIWTKIYDRYFKDPKKEYDSWLTGYPNDKRLWDLDAQKNWPFFVQVVNLSTFDKAIIRKKNYKRYAEHLREFFKEFDQNGPEVCHLLAWADFIENCEAEAVGFYATSVGSNLWVKYDEEMDISIPYNINTEDQHFEVYEWLEK